MSTPSATLPRGRPARLFCGRVLPAALTAFVTLALVACSSGAQPRRIDFSAETPVPEQLSYQLTDRSGQSYGTAVLSTRQDGSDLALEQAYQGPDGTTDRSVVRVDPGSMAPKSSVRDITVGGRKRHITTTYQDGTAAALYESGATSTTHTVTVTSATYDNQESFWLWRRLPLEAGAEYTYATVVVDTQSGAINRPVATVRVTGVDELKVGDQTIRAWRLVFDSAGVRNTVWLRDGAAHEMVRYELASGLIYELAPSGG